MSTWCLFEWTDVAGWLARSGDDRGAVSALRAMAAQLEADVARGGTEPELNVRRALYRAAVAQLGVLAGDPPADAREVFRTAAADLDSERRVFEAARIRLWMAEAGDSDALEAALATFQELRAGPYVERARGGG